MRQAVAMSAVRMRGVLCHPLVDRALEIRGPAEPEVIMDLPDFIDRVAHQRIESDMQPLVWGDRSQRRCSSLEDELGAVQAFLAQRVRIAVGKDQVAEAHDHATERW